MVALRDDAGRAHPVMADVGCRNTVFGAEAQEASRHLDAWRAAGIAHFRLEFAHESGEQTARNRAPLRERAGRPSAGARTGAAIAEPRAAGRHRGQPLRPGGVQRVSDLAVGQWG